MKKAISLFLALIMCLSLCACGKSEAVKETEDPLSAFEILQKRIGRSA